MKRLAGILTATLCLLGVLWLLPMSRTESYQSRTEFREVTRYGIFGYRVTEQRGPAFVSGDPRHIKWPDPVERSNPVALAVTTMLSAVVVCGAGLMACWPVWSRRRSEPSPVPAP